MSGSVELADRVALAPDTVEQAAVEIENLDVVLAGVGDEHAPGRIAREPRRATELARAETA